MIDPGIVTGNNAQASWLNKLRRLVLSLRLLPGQGYKVRYDTNGTFLDIVPGAGGGTTTKFKMHKFVSMANEYIVCRTWDGTTLGTTDVTVAKPYKLRFSITSVVVDGQTITYTDYSGQTRFATANGVSSQEVITPR